MAYIDPSHYQHPLDVQATAALRAVPGFEAFVRAFMKEFSERRFFIENKSTHIELSSHQVPEVYNLLPPICDRLGIPVPKLYLSGSRELNAYTSGETEPFIVVNAGALECCSEQTIRCILAHECGHIAAHHSLYTTIGEHIRDGLIELLPGVGGFVSYGLQVAFFAWSRASEYTADRVAALALGGTDSVVDTCVVLAGAHKGLGLSIDAQKFLEQAVEYEQAIGESTTNKIFEYLDFNETGTHPLNAYRALEIARWGQTEEFASMNAFLDEVAAGREKAGDPEFVEMASAEAVPNEPVPLVEEVATPGAFGFCGQCGAPLTQDCRFCVGCGCEVPRS